MREMSALTSGLSLKFANDSRNFIGKFSRRAANPECISALTERAVARALASDGHSFRSGNSSLRYSQIASESQMTVSPSIRTGTRPEGEYFPISRAVDG